jgi:ketosteroid isomerase-like protein
MKRSILVCAAVIAAAVTTASAQAPAGGQGRGGRPNIFAPEVQATGPIADFVKSLVTAFNNKDTAFFQKTIAPDAVWLDEDGHHLLASVWITRLLSANPPRKLSITNLRVGSLDANAGWAGFNYIIEGTGQVKGTNSLVLKKSGNDWQIALIHGAVDTAIAAH